jgi:hypothetical protein
LSFLKTQNTIGNKILKSSLERVGVHVMTPCGWLALEEAGQPASVLLTLQDICCPGESLWVWAEQHCLGQERRYG